VSQLAGIAGIEYSVRPMLAMPALQLPTNDPGDWAAEPKLDGFLT
jgi:ATP-dependent DNA ligase